jgi:hypothetical protein
MATVGTTIRSVQPASAVGSILRAGLLAGVLDGTDATVFTVIRGGTVKRLFQFIASGALGPKSFAGGWSTAALGLGFHFLIAIGAAATYYGLSLKIPALVKRPALCGPLFGIAVLVFMHYGVVAISAIPLRPFGTASLINQLFAHIFCVGLPIAYMTRRARLQ